MYTTFEVFLANFSFIILLLSMLFYWFEASSSNQEYSNVQSSLDNKKNISFNSSIFKIMSKKVLGSLGMLISNISLFILLVLRWIESGHFPLSNLYESLMFLSWSLTLIHLLIEWPLVFRTKDLEGIWSGPSSLLLDTTFNFVGTKQKRKILVNKLIGSITAPSALFTNAFATFSLPKEMQESSPLVPALQSNWLMMHVTVMILSYAALILGSLLSIGFLVISNGLKPTESQPQHLPYMITTGSAFMVADPSDHPASLNQVGSETLKNPRESLLAKSWGGNLSEHNDGAVERPKATTNKESSRETPSEIINIDEEKKKISKGFSRLNLAKTLDNLSYRILGLGFPLLTIGILSGAVWANEAWGSYWSWDPKETWALLTWLVFAIYLHTRLTKGWEGKKPALIASLGFVTVWVCFLGVNLIGEGLHSYGWIS